MSKTAFEKSRALLFVLTLGFPSAVPLHAASDYLLTIDKIKDPFKRLPQELYEGLQLEVAISLGGLGQDQNPKNPSQGVYLSTTPGAGITIKIPPICNFAPDPQKPALKVTVANDLPQLGDVVVLESTNNLPLCNNEPVNSIQLSFTDPSGKAFAGDQLPPIPLSHDTIEFDGNIIVTGGGQNLPWEIVGNVGLVDNCRPGVWFHFQQGPPSFVEGATNYHRADRQVVDIPVGATAEVYPALSSNLPPGGGIQTFSFSISVGGNLRPIAIDSLGTVSDDISHPPGFFHPAGTDSYGFRRMELIDPDQPGRDGERQGEGVVGAVVWSLSLPVTLPPVCTAPMARILVQGRPGFESREAQGVLSWRDELRGPGIPVPNLLSVDGANVTPCGKFSLDLTIRPYSLPEYFIRGDINGDAHIDLSDSISIFSHLFLGGTQAICLSASDTNSDKKLDMSDGIYLLQYLYNGGSPPKAPFGECGKEDFNPNASCDVSACK